MPPREAQLARGFILGEDDEIDAATVEDFRRAGLSHLLAVSGQNVALLVLLAMPLLAALGLPLRTRLIWILAAIAVYVPLAGGGPSIVRAGVMGGLSVLATLAGRRTTRLYSLALAALLTLAIDPKIAGDIGWQLSFAAVLGILLLGPVLRTVLAARLGSRAWGRTVAEGLAITVAATVATAPLIAFHFEALSTVSLLSNLLVLPAVAPAMWLGMLTAIGGQVPGFPAAVPNALAAPLLAYIAQVAAWCGRPSWAYLSVGLGLTGVVAAYLAIGIVAIAAPVLWRRRRLAARRRGVAGESPRRRLVALLAAAVVLLGWAARERDGAGSAPARGLRVSVLDVGQGDAILFQPAGAPAVLVDGGPPGDGLEAKLRAAGVDSLGAAVVTHEQSDHSGGIGEVLSGFPIERLLYARLGRRLRRQAWKADVAVKRIAAGASVRSGALRFEVLWPPPELLDDPLAGADPNGQGLVMLARWRAFSMLLTADAEAAEVPIDPGPVDVLKVAHHGSEDDGLDALLGKTSPGLAVISVGAGNPFGHPTPETLGDLSANRVPFLRTDRDGTIVLIAEGNSFGVGTSHQGP